MKKAPLVFGIAGWKNSGKTTLVSGLVNHLVQRGLKVSTLKHAHHQFDLDQAGTDSFKHRTAGAQEVMLVSENRWALQHELGNDPEPAFEEMLAKLSPCDVVLVEGYKRENIAKIEILGDESKHEALWPSDSNIKAIASDAPVEGCALPRFHRSDIAQMADFILQFQDAKQ